MSIGSAQLTALVELISSSVREVIAAYSDARQDSPLLNLLDEGPLEIPATTPPNVTKARQIIEAACAQLCATIAQSGDCIVNYTKSACLQVTVDMKIFDLLLNKPKSLAVEEMAKLSGINAGKLGQVLRFLVTKHVYREVQPNVYTNNTLSMKLLSSDPVCFSIFVHYQPSYSTYMWEALVDEKYSSSYDPSQTAFCKVNGAPFFEYYKKCRFSSAMIGWRDITDRGLLPKMYDWQSLVHNAVVCDVSGSNGHVALDLLKEYLKLKIVVQDLEDLQTRWSELKELPDMIQQARTAFIPIDFFKDAPVKDCNIYYIHNILHDWLDESCVKILQNVKLSMKPTSRILILCFVANHQEALARDGDDLAPEPLLPNYGNGRIQQYNLDVNLMICFKSKERTLKEFIDIGWVLTRYSSCLSNVIEICILL
ncbi:uncharacterized protein PHACADRAFT_92239 [Phanerochaete carnosa HHB-10118-sp]|uniref:Uncharacterized protein n=1 Tax=Phanerochaete carnosa (strain HHB-10118-sp) TaxID=650164 RepID=K5WDK3_PHACS|nr:uncharacterized protein PHACADRAFT_92239 [Phanerochaete carnosa HHB-10118-sp]EKM57114.1 hypothetical protein PHACADRAFT_92239 [Phanerochaete carnosa HHB-10118-sp]